MALDNTDPKQRVITHKVTPEEIRQRKLRGSGFTNINKIIGANKDNRLGSAVSSGVKGFVGSGKQQLGSAQQKFQEQMKQGALGTEEQQQERQNIIGKATGDQAADIGQQEQSRFSRFLSGQYTGPQQMKDLSGTTTQAQELQRGLGTQEGRQSLLGRFIGQGQPYTSGQKRTDTMLLGQAQPQLNRAQQNLSALRQDINKRQSGAQQQAQAAQGQAQTFAQQTREQLGTKESDIDKQLAEQVTAEEGKASGLQAKFNKLQDYLKNPVDTSKNAGTMQYNALTNIRDLDPEGIGNIQNLAFFEAFSGKNKEKDRQKFIAQRIADRAAEQGAFLGSNINNRSPEQIEAIRSNLQRTLGALDQGVQNGLLSSEDAQKMRRQAFASANTGSNQTAEDLLRGIQFKGAQNLTKSGVMSDKQAASLDALARLGGLQRSSATQNRNPYEAAGIKTEDPSKLFLNQLDPNNKYGVGDHPDVHLIRNPITGEINTMRTDEQFSAAPDPTNPMGERRRRYGYTGSGYSDISDLISKDKGYLDRGPGYIDDILRQYYQNNASDLNLY